MRVASNIAELIGNTPLVRIDSVSKQCGANIIGKCEFLNPTGSVKDRIGRNMIEDALKSGRANKDTTIIEPTSGNTGIALASVCAAYGMKLILTMPESMSIERRSLMKSVGAKLILTPANKGMQGAIDKAHELESEIDNSLILHQFQNPANPMVHKEHTAKEIIRDMDGDIDVFVTSVGTGGSIMGISQALKAHNSSIKIVAVEPYESQLLSGGSHSPHKIQGIGAGFIPKIVDIEAFDEVIKVKSQDAIECAKMLSMDDGIMVGISSGANVYAAKEIGSRAEYRGKNIVTILCDNSLRYLSTELFSET